MVKKLYNFSCYYNYSVFFLLIFSLNNKEKKYMKKTIMKKNYFSVDKKQILNSLYMSNAYLVFSLPKILDTIYQSDNNMNTCIYYEKVMYSKYFISNFSVKYTYID